MNFDRRIMIQRASVERNGFNEAVETWATLVTVWAHFADVSAAESLRAQEVAAQLDSRFTVRRYTTTTATVTTSDRISFEGKVYNIVGVREKERGRYIEIDAAARTGDAQVEA